MPPSSRGLGRNPFKVKTRIRIPLGAPDDARNNPPKPGGLFLLPGSRIRDEHEESKRDHGLSDQYPGRLQGTKIGRLGRKLGSHTKHICHPGEYGYDKAGGNQPHPNIGYDGTLFPAPQRRQTHISPETNNCQTEKKKSDFYEADSGASIPAEPGSFGPDREEEEPDEGCDQSDPHSYARRSIHRG